MSDFDFDVVVVDGEPPQTAENLAMPAEKVTDLTASGRGRGAGGRGRKAQGGSPTCFCGQAKEGKDARCARHKRAFECIWRDYVKKAGSDTERARTFYTIFGNTKRAEEFPGQPDIAEQVLMDFCDQFPESVDGSRAKRGDVNLSKFAHVQGCRKATDEVSASEKMDWELFAGKMKLFRCWDKEVARQHWRALEADDNVDRDNKGIKDSNGRPTLRLAIPPSYFGGDATEERMSSYEDKSMSREGKAVKNMDEETFNKYLGECRKGFKESNQSDFISLMQEATQKLGKHSLTFSGGSQRDAVEEMLRVALHGTSSQESWASSSASGSATPLGAPGSPGADSKSCSAGQQLGEEKDRKTPKKVDISKMRADECNSWKRDFDGSQRKVVDMVDSSTSAQVAANKSLDSDFLSLVVERTKMAQLWLGHSGISAVAHAAAPAGDSAVAPACDPAAASAAASGDASASLVATSKATTETSGVVNEVKVEPSGADGEPLVKKPPQQAEFEAFVLSLKLLPVETPDKIKVLPLIMERIDELRSCEDEAQIRVIGSELSRMKELVNQMLVALKAVVRSLVQNKTRRDKQAEKEERKGAEKRSADEAKLQKAEMQAKKAKAMTTKNDGPFKLNLKSVGHPEIMKVSNDAFVGSSDYTYDEPLVITENEPNMGIEQSSKATAYLQKWGTNFPSTSTAVSCYRCAAPCSSVHGCEDLLEVLAPLVQEPQCDLPESVAKDCDSLWWFGFTNNHARFDVEPLGLGSLRYVHTGSMAVVACEVSAMQQHIEQGRPGTKVTMENMEEAASLLTEATARKMHEQKVALHHGMVKANEVLLIPPGWLVGTCTVNNSHVPGVRMPHMAGTTQHVLRNLQAMEEVLRGSESSAALQALVASLTKGKKAATHR